jgi:hypothetical protein
VFLLAGWCSVIGGLGWRDVACGAFLRVWLLWVGRSLEGV